MPLEQLIQPLFSPLYQDRVIPSNTKQPVSPARFVPAVVPGQAEQGSVVTMFTPKTPGQDIDTYNLTFPDDT